MKKRQGLVRKAEVERYVLHYKRHLRMADWDHELTIGRGKPDEAASVQPDIGRKIFYLTFFPRTFADPELGADRSFTLEAVIIHELLHVIFAPVYYATAIEAEMKMENFKLIQKHLEEPMIDTLARVLARYLPRPRPLKIPRRTP